jgi:ketosteroid isomerase-like protein
VPKKIVRVFVNRKMRVQRFRAVIVGLTCAAAIVPPAQAASLSSTADRVLVCAGPNLLAIKRTFERDMKHKDLNVLTLYAPAAVFTNPDGSQVSGAALRRLFVAVFGRFDSDLHLRAGRVFGTKNGGCVEEGSFSELQRARAGGKTTNSTGRYRFRYVPGAGGRWRFKEMKWAAGTGAG